MQLSGQTWMKECKDSEHSRDSAMHLCYLLEGQFIDALGHKE